MFRNAFSAVLLFLISMSCTHAQSAQSPTAAASTEIAMRYVHALDSGNWELARAMHGVAGATHRIGPDRLQTIWNDWESWRGSEKDWGGPPRVEARYLKSGEFANDLVLIPILRTNGNLVIRITVAEGKVDGLGLAPDHAVFGPYATLEDKELVWSDGSKWLWYISPSGRSVVRATRGPTGQLLGLELVKAVGNGSLVMWRWPDSDCPSNVCGQAGSLKDGVISWRDPKGTDGQSGGYMDVKMWIENGALVTYRTNPAPHGGVQLHDLGPEWEYLRPKPERYVLARFSGLAPALVAESDAKIAELEPLVEAEVAKALGKQAATSQRLADAREKKQQDSERAQSFNRLMGSVNEVLTEANAVATVNEAQSRADLDATIAAMNAQAEAQRMQQARGQRPVAPAKAQAAAPAQVVQPVAQQRAADQGSSRQNAASGPKGGEPATASGQPLRFVLRISLRNQPGDKVNPTCYSNVITRDGPPGWGAPGFLPSGSAEQAHATIQSLKTDFIARCRASGREITSEGNFTWHSNQTAAGEQQIADARPKYREDVSVSLN
jgi:hypothetical protein